MHRSIIALPREQVKRLSGLRQLFVGRHERRFLDALGFAWVPSGLCSVTLLHEYAEGDAMGPVPESAAGIAGVVAG